MKNVKKVLALALSSVMVASALVGCASKTEKPAEDTKAPVVEKKDVTLNIFQFKVEIAKELQEATKAYTAENPNVKINVETVGGGDDYGAALRAKIQGGTEPTIFNIGGPQDVKDWESRLVDLTNEPWTKQALDGVLSGVTVNEKVFAMPFAVEGYGFIYNKGIFEAAGVSVADVKDFASLEKAVKALDAKIKAGELKTKYPNLESVFELPAKETWVTGLHTSNAAISQEFKSSLDAFAAKTLEFKNAEGLKSLIDLQANYSPNAKTKGNLNATDYATQVDQGLAIERVAMVQQGNWIYGGVKAIDAKVADQLDMLPMPIVGAKEDSIPMGVPMYWAVNNKGSVDEQAAAKSFLNWLYTSEKGKDFVVNKFFFIPPFKGYESLQPKDPLGAAVKKYAEAGKTSPWVFMGYPTGWGMDVLGQEIQKYLAGKQDWNAVITNSKAKWAESRK
ncbi:ABC transporter substrate-binding protein [Clostridium sp. CS001]|uniref:ABC transporter substrate-binding protein n=1 Tax=Clostridium sp. CS001 TaxID=2880648 RepID=UPI001CF11EF0|nr:ABC transporter substrate-binding protein [Clostridium sp. CS001]MCB2288672.1 ABC transporter substrate-binding protein [Clostridium sp. CS001]